MNRIFGKLKMNWIMVVLFAIIAGVYTGAIMCVPALENTSFQDIGISFEWWVIFAIIIVVNCKNGIEAAFKCFVFFMISQPLVYITEVLMGHLSWEMAKFYYFQAWFKPSLLTLPGGLIAYYCKKQNWIGAIILAFGNAIQFLMGVHYSLNAFQHFPYHILSAIVSFGSIIVMSLCIQKEKKYQLVSILLPIVLFGCVYIFCIATGRGFGL